MSTIARNLVTTVAGTQSIDYYGDDVVSGFTLTAVEGGWEVSDGSASEVLKDGAAALRRYADYIDTFVDDMEGVAQMIAFAEMGRALKDANKLEGRDTYEQHCAK